MKKKLNLIIEKFAKSKKKIIISFILINGLIGSLIFFINSRKPVKQVEKTTKKEENIKKVTVFRAGERPKLKINLEVEKTGIITINSQTSGIIKKIHIKEGDKVAINQRLFDISNNYQGGNLFSNQREIAYRQYKEQQENLPLQKEIINNQRKITEKNFENIEELRKISRKSIDETKSLLSQNEGILKTIENQLKQLEQQGANENATLQLRQQRAQYSSTVNQLRQILRQNEYSLSENSPESQISSIQKETTLKQLELQEKSLQFSLDLAHLQYRTALIQESLMYPVSPVNGTVEKIYVKMNQNVNPGTALAVITEDKKNQKITASAILPSSIVTQIDLNKNSNLFIKNQKISVKPLYITSEAVDGGFYNLIFEIPKEFASLISHKDYITGEIFLNFNNLINKDSFYLIPIDAVHQLSNENYVFIIENNVSKAKKIELGQVYGNFVEVKGLKEKDEIILERNITSGTKVKKIN